MQLGNTALIIMNQLLQILTSALCNWTPAMLMKIALILRVDLSVCVNLVSLDYQRGAQVSEFDVM